MFGYRVNDLPHQGLGAFTPTLTRLPLASSWGEVGVFGAPGSMNVAAPKPAALPPLGPDRRTQPSWCAPDVIRPAIYVASTAHMHPPVPVRPPNVMPVPATALLRSTVPVFSAPKVGGRRAIPWPRTFQRFT